MTKNPCKHLEKLLPSADQAQGPGGRHLMFVADLNTVKQTPLWDSAPSHLTEERFIRQIQGYDLGAHHVLLLVERFVNSKTLAEITRDQGFTSVGVTNHYLKQAIDLLRQRGFYLRKEA